MTDGKQLNRSRVLHLLKFLYGHSDEFHQVTVADLIQELADNGLNGNRVTIRHDIDIMIEAGFDIVINEGSPAHFFWGSRGNFEIPELKLLIDAVSSSHFISEKKSQELIKKLINLAGEGEGSKLAARIYTADQIKADNQQIYLIVDTICHAIDEDTKIQFQYFDYSENREKILHNDGEVYTASPYAMLWKDDRYYMLAHSDKHEKIVPFRVDRLYKPQVLDAKRIPAPENFVVSDYSSKVFDMFTGEEETVLMRCKNELMRVMVDFFGENFSIKESDADSFLAQVSVSTSPTFFGWIFKFGGDIRIVSPNNVKKQYKEMLQKSLEE